MKSHLDNDRKKGDGTVTTQLDPPGAGLPDFERRVANVMLRIASRGMSRTRAANLMSNETRRILVIARELSPEQGAERVLIDRVVGIEDSSRDWSVLMVLEHLCIVNDGVAAIIESLHSGDRLDREVRIEDVKPHADAGSDFIGRLEQSVKDFLAKAESIPRFSTRQTFFHPWFGEMNAKQWYTLAAVHTRIHRKQVEAIVANQSQRNA